MEHAVPQWGFLIAAHAGPALDLGYGLDPGLMVAGLVGGWWALVSMDAMLSLPKRLSMATISALIGTWLGPPGASFAAAGLARLFDWWPATELTRQALLYPSAAITGLLIWRGIAPLIGIARDAKGLLR